MRKFIFGVLAFLAGLPTLIFTFVYNWPWIRLQLIRLGAVIAVIVLVVVATKPLREKRYTMALKRSFAPVSYTKIKNPTISMKTPQRRRR